MVDKIRHFNCLFLSKQKQPIFQAKLVYLETLGFCGKFRLFNSTSIMKPLPASRDLQTLILHFYLFEKKISEFVDLRLGVPSNEQNIGSKIHSIFIMLNVCTQKSISYKDLQRLHWLHHLILNASRNIRGKGLYIFTVGFWCQTIHKKFLRRFDTIFGLK